MKKILLALSLCILCGCQYDATAPSTRDKSIMWAMQPCYTSASSFSNGLAYVNFEGQPLVINQSGTAVERGGDASLANWSVNSPLLAVKEENQKKGLVNRAGQWIIQPTYDDIELQKGIPLCKRNDITCFINQAGLPTNACGLDSFFVASNNGEYLVVGHSAPPDFNSTEYYIIDSMTGQRIIERSFCQGPRISTGDFFTFCDNGKYGVMDFAGNITVQPQYDDAGWFSEGLASVQNNRGEVAYIDAKGSIVVPFRSGIYGGPFYNGLAALAVYKQGAEKVGLIDTAGQWVVKPEFDSYFYYEDKDAWELIKWTERDDIIRIYFPRHQLLTAEYDYYIDLISTSCFIAFKGDAAYVVNISAGKEQRTEFGIIYEHSEGLIRATENGGTLIGFASHDGKWVHAPQFQDAKPFCEGLAAVKLDGKWGYIAHPTVYSSWHDRESDRARMVLECPGNVDEHTTISTGEFIRLLNSHIPTADIALSVPTDSSHPLSRAMAASIIGDIMKSNGKYYEYYTPQVEDVDLLGLDSEIAYVIQERLIEPQDSLFVPLGPVSHEDAAVIAYRIVLRLLN